MEPFHLLHYVLPRFSALAGPLDFQQGGLKRLLVQFGEGPPPRIIIPPGVGDVLACGLYKDGRIESLVLLPRVSCQQVAPPAGSRK